MYKLLKLDFNHTAPTLESSTGYDSPTVLFDGDKYLIEDDPRGWRVTHRTTGRNMVVPSHKVAYAEGEIAKYVPPEYVALEEGLTPIAEPKRGPGRPKTNK